MGAGDYRVSMRLTMAQRQAVTKAAAVRYRSESESAKGVILAELCELTGWHRDHARKALRAALGPRPARRQRALPPPLYGDDGAALTDWFYAQRGTSADWRGRN